MTTRAHEVEVQAQRVVEAAKHLFVTGVLSHGGHETQGDSLHKIQGDSDSIRRPAVYKSPGN